MNQPIRCEPLPFSGVTETAAGEAPSRTSASKAKFGEFLDAKLETADQDKPRKGDSEKRRESDTLASYGVIGASTPLLQPPPVVILATSLSAAVSDPTPPTDAELKSASPGPDPGAETALHALPGAAGQEQSSSEGHSTEQKLPPGSKLPAPAIEQIAQKAPQPAKIARGMVAAQGPLMPIATPSKEETTQKVGIEHFEAVSFEQPIRLDNFREPAPSKPAVPEVTALESTQPEMPALETVSGDFEFQPVRSVEPTAIVEAIRTHVELLRTSGMDRLEVVLRPDAQTELRLHVEMVNGIVQVQARCERGDFALLDSHWNSIQNSLANQGVRVEPLQQGSSMQFQQQSQDFRDFLGRDSKQPSREEFFIEQEFLNHPKDRSQKAVASRGTAVRGWQSWA